MAEKKKTSQNKLDYIHKFTKERYVKKLIYISLDKEKDIISHLEKQDSISGYIKELIKKDMTKA